MKFIQLLIFSILGLKCAVLRPIRIQSSRPIISQIKQYWLIWTVFLSFILVSPAMALNSPHPIQLYEKGNTILASYRGNQAQLEQAEQYYIQCINKFPQSPFGYLGMSKVNNIKSYLYGNRYNMMQIREDSLPFAIKSLELGPSLREVHEHYAVYEQIFEQYYENQKRAQDYLSLFPDHPETFFVIATFLNDQGESKKALEYYKSALDLSPTEAMQLKILKRIAHIYLFTFDKPDKAAEYYEQALTILNTSANLHEYLGISYLKMHKYQLAIENLEKAMELLDTKTPEFYLLLARGYQLEESGDLEHAIDYLEKASASGKKDSTLHYRLGNLYYKASNFGGAYSHFKRVIDLKPQESNAYYFAGRSAFSLGEKELAFDYYTKFLQLNSEGQEADWIRANNPDLPSVNEIP